MKKRRLELFQTNDNEAIEKHLAKMAKKGWFLEKMGKIFWTYRSGEPQNLTYEVTYFSEASDFNPYPTDNQEAYYEYCEAAGWTLVAEKEEMQVFRAVREDTTPIETDEALRFQSIHKFMMKKMILPYEVAVLFTVIGMFSMLKIMKRNPIMFFTESTDFYNSFLLVVNGIVMLYFLIDYGIWYYGSKKALVLGIRYDKDHYKGRRIAAIIDIFALIIVIILQLMALLSESYWYIIIIVVIALPTVLVSFIVKKLMKKAGFSREENISITCVAILLVGSIMACITYSLANRGAFDEGLYNSYNYENKSFHPLTIEDLNHDSQENNLNTSEGKSSYTFETDDSLVVSYSYMFQESQLDYEVATIKIGKLYDTFKNYYLDTYEFYGGGTFILVDEPAWEALEVYRLKTDISLRNMYVVCYEDKILYISLYFSLDTDQIKLIRERLIEEGSI